ncbi:MAG: hypothetical protein DMF59_05275 [Acidobacteria bacterium]|nr:MAG: hypothetical protein DMF59_05275 [Acidobacteriota bacterium]
MQTGGTGLGLMPVNDVATNTFKIARDSGSSTTFYKPDAGSLFCDLPFGPADKDKFFGFEDSADLTIDRTTAAGQTFLDTFNTKLLGPESTTDARPAGEITAIKLFAPPIVGWSASSPTPPRFYQAGTRYGVCTIMVRAEKFDQPSTAATRRSIALAECRIVVSQFPLPTPGGPLQSATSLATNGNFNVHWGLVSSQQSLDLKKDYSTVPWFNAYERIHFNRGYDSSWLWSPNTVYRVGAVVRPLPATVAANPQLRPHEYTITVFPVAPGNTGPNEPDGQGGRPLWPTAVGGTISLNGVTYTERASTAYPLPTVGLDSQPWLYFISRGNITVDDPWFQARTAQNDAGAPNGNSQPWPFNPANPNQSVAPLGPGQVGGTWHFQFQNFDQYPNFKQLIFPIINYDFWKSAAVAASNEQGVKYLRWVTADQYTDGVATQTFRQWASSQPGFYFFETQNAQNPQNGQPGILAPGVSINGGGAYMGSFIYLNADFNTTGLSGPTGNFNEPGEPYMDIGYRQVDLSSPTGDFVRDAAGVPIVEGAANRQWDYQDLPWSNTGGIGGGTPNGVFDVFVAPRTVHDPADTANPNSSYTGYFPVAYTPGCKPGDNSCAGCDCSEPHEPYLNIKYTSNTLGIQFGWFDPASTPTATMRKPKKTTDGTRTGTPVTCMSNSPPTDCTSNAYDLDGGLVSLPPATDGVLYVEGQFNSTGNADYYGSVLVGGSVNTKGTPNLWYDESLSRGIRLSGFPRVMVTSVETDR